MSVDWVSEVDAATADERTALTSHSSKGELIEERGEIDFLKDGQDEMTFGRRIALRLMDKKWYNPRAGLSKQDLKEDFDDDDDDEEEEDMNNNKSVSERQAVGPSTRRRSLRPSTSRSRRQPSLRKAWAYFEHFALSRYVHDKTAGEVYHRKSEPGENVLKTRLYDPFCTPHCELGDFGLGAGLYFSSLRFVSILTFVCGLINIGNMSYFASEEYDTTNHEESILLFGSAICSDTSWVPCPTCTCNEEGAKRMSAYRMREGNYFPSDRCYTDSDGVTYALRNNCGEEIPFHAGMTTLATVIVFFVSILFLGKIMYRDIVFFDESEQTAQDYSVQVSNPPPDASEPDEWHDFFKTNFDGAHVAVCTVTVDNDLLIRTMVERRECSRIIVLILDPEEEMDDNNLARLAAKIERERTLIGRMIASISPGIPELYARLSALNAKVKGLAQLEYPVTKVFLTFETEEDQRNVLNKLSVGYWQACMNNINAVADPRYLFRGKQVLYVREPDEPDTLRRQDLNASVIQRLRCTIFTTIATLIGLVLSFLIVQTADDYFDSVYVVSYTISAINSIFPKFAIALTNTERHPSEDNWQTSLYFKIALFRWMNTAFVLTMITPFQETLEGDGVIYKVYALFYSEIIVTTGLQLSDIAGQINRHYLAPRAKNQDGMNLMFQGTEWHLAVLYTEMTNFLLLSVWYFAIYPGAFFMCSVCLGLKYYVDRFSLMRTWKRAPHIGTRVAKATYKYFFPVAIVPMVVMCTVYWSGFPYDNLCHVGDNDEYRPCNQDYHYGSKEKEWMSGDQKMIGTYFTYTTIVVTVVVLSKFIWDSIKGYRSLCVSDYKPIGKDQNIPFSSLNVRSGYILDVVSPLFSFPLIPCRTEDVTDEELHSWKDPDHPYSYYDLSRDADELLKQQGHSNFSHEAGFDRIKCYPPPGSSTEIF